MAKIKTIGVWGLEESIVGSKFPMSVDIESLTPEITTTVNSLASSGKSEVAIFLLNTTYSKTDIQLPELIPSTEPYVYYFTVANNNGVDRTETSLEYDLFIRTTTNLPLEFKLYLDEDYTNSSSTNLFTNSELITDVDGTYFKKLSISKRYFGYTQNEIDNYTLLIYFPYEYIDYSYEGVIESIELIVDAKQVIE